MINYLVTQDKGIGHWRFSCILTFPWRPILSGMLLASILLSSKILITYPRNKTFRLTSFSSFFIKLRSISRIVIWWHLSTHVINLFIARIITHKIVVYLTIEKCCSKWIHRVLLWCGLRKSVQVTLLKQCNFFYLSNIVTYN